jgi:uncharacterized protein
MALEEYLRPTRMLIVRGPAAEADAWRVKLAALYLPSTVTIAISNEARALPEVLAKPSTGKVNAWLCEGRACLPPIAEWGQLLEALTEAPSGADRTRGDSPERTVGPA